MAGLKMRPYRRIVAYQTWRALSEPPQDFPLALTDSRSVEPGQYVVMENITGPREQLGAVGDSRMALPGNHTWYYFSGLTSREVIVFKGYDTANPEGLNVYHASFDNRRAEPNAHPRASIETRMLAFWK